MDTCGPPETGDDTDASAAEFSGNRSVREHPHTAGRFFLLTEADSAWTAQLRFQIRG